MSKNKPFSRPGVSLLFFAAAMLITSPQTAGAAQSFDGPITIRKGGTYRGSWRSLDPNKAAVEIETSEPVIIEYSRIESRGPLIRGRYARANLTVRHTRGVGLNPNLPVSKKRHPGYFVHLEEFQNAYIHNNELTGTAGIYFRRYLGNAARGHTVRVLRNRARNIDGRYSTGKDQFSNTEFYRVQFVQFNDVKDIAKAEIAWNEVINEPGKSRVEENINMFSSRGTAQSPISIHDNYIQGAYPAQPTSRGYAGGGMMLGDGSASSLAAAGGFVRAFNNQIVGTSNQGIAVAAGHDIEVFNNRVISSGLLPDGRPIGSQNVGIYIWDLYGDQRRGTYFNNVARNNLIAWAKPMQSPTAQNPIWRPGCAPNKCNGNTTMPGPITLQVEAEEYKRWRAKVTSAKIVLGPQGP